MCLVHRVLFALLHVVCRETCVCTYFCCLIGSFSGLNINILNNLNGIKVQVFGLYLDKHLAGNDFHVTRMTEKLKGWLCVFLFLCPHEDPLWSPALSGPDVLTNQTFFPVSWTSNSGFRFVVKLCLHTKFFAFNFN